MTTVRNNPARIGCFTSSEIVSLFGEPTAAAKKQGAIIGQAAHTYIAECNMERRLRLPLTTDINARPLSWGKLVEYKAFEIMGFEYKHSSQDTFVHPEIEYWSGSPDGHKFDEGKTVFDIKCPLTRKSFCQLVDCKTIEEVVENHKEGEKYKWQLISNAILTDSKFCELIVYMPYLEELEDIRDMASQLPEETQKHYYWLNTSSNEELPYLIKGGYYKNFNVIRFEVTEEDRNKIIERVKYCGQFLQK